MLSATHIPDKASTPPWLADESPLNDLDEAENDTELDDGDLLPDEVLEQLEKAPPPPAPMPEPGVM